jgi:hypothetical protein
MKAKLNNEQQVDNPRITMWADFINTHQFSKVAEVGVWKGEFAKGLISQCPSIQCYTLVDSWRHLDGWNKPFNISDDEFAHVYRQAMEAVAFSGNKVRVLRGTTLEVRDQIDDQSLDFVYIDGDHSLRGIVVDAISMWPKLREGGVLAGDDFTENVWQHSREYEPSLVNPFMRYFADAVGEELNVLPHGQFFIRKSAASGSGGSKPASASCGLLPLLKLGETSESMRGKSDGNQGVLLLAKRVVKAIARRCSVRYREYDAKRWHGQHFPEHFRRLGVVFIHVPKAAGTSISLALYGRGSKHISLADYWTKFPYSMRKVKTCAVFRDPLERFCSAFHYLKKGGMNKEDAQFAATHLSQYDSPSQLAEAFSGNFEPGKILNFMHFRPQVSWVCDPLSKRVVDCLVSLQRLDALRIWLQEMTGKEFEFPKANVSGSGEVYQSGLSAEAEEILRSVYAQDFEVYRALIKNSGSLIASPRTGSKVDNNVMNLLLR